MSIKIRPMEYTHWPKVCEIYTQGIRQGLATFTTSPPDYETWDATHHKFCRLIAVDENEKVLGFAALSPTYTAKAYSGVAELSIYIDDDSKGKGIGKALLTHMCQLSENFGIWTIHSSIIENNKASINLHYSCGFRMIGYRENISKDINGIWRNTVLMERRSQKFC